MIASKRPTFISRLVNGEAHPRLKLGKIKDILDPKPPGNAKPDKAAQPTINPPLDSSLNDETSTGPASKRTRLTISSLLSTQPRDESVESSMDDSSSSQSNDADQVEIKTEPCERELTSRYPVRNSASKYNHRLDRHSASSSSKLISDMLPNQTDESNSESNLGKINLRFGRFGKLPVVMPKRKPGAPRLPKISDLIAQNPPIKNEPVSTYSDTISFDNTIEMGANVEPPQDPVLEKSVKEQPRPKRSLLPKGPLPLSKGSGSILSTSFWMKSRSRRADAPRRPTICEIIGKSPSYVEIRQDKQVKTKSADPVAQKRVKISEIVESVSDTLPTATVTPTQVNSVEPKPIEPVSKNSRNNRKIIDILSSQNHETVSAVIEKSWSKTPISQIIKTTGGDDPEPPKTKTRSRSTVINDYLQYKNALSSGFVKKLAQKKHPQYRLFISEILNNQPTVDEPTQVPPAADPPAPETTVDVPPTVVVKSEPFIKTEPVVVDENQEMSADARGAICVQCERCFVASADQQQFQSDESTQPLGNKLNKMAHVAQEDSDLLNGLCPDCAKRHQVMK